MVPAVTAQVARAAFPKGSLAIRICDALGALFETPRSRRCLRPGAARRSRRRGWRWCRCWKFADGLSDHQAADAVRARIDWTDDLGLELPTPGLTPRCSGEFRARLLADDQTERLLGRMLDRLRERACWCGVGGSAPMPPARWRRCGS
jgi:hypothetical protein